MTAQPSVGAALSECLPSTRAATDGWRVTNVSRNIRYLAVAAVCAVVNNILLILLVKSGINYFVGIWLAYIPMLFIAYALHAGVTFRVDPSPSSLFRYALATLANYPLWIGSLFVLYSVLKLPITVAAPIGTVIAFMGNYLAAHWAIAWRRRHRHDTATGDAATRSGSQ